MELPGTQSEPGPDSPSSDYKAMVDYWAMVDAILGGAPTMRAAGPKYLPKFENESEADYSHRKKAAPFTNIYTDISRNLASKPFGRELTLKDTASDELKRLCEDIDGQGNNLHVFGAATFQNGLDKAIDWILVDYTKAPVDGRVLTLAEERDQGRRPYWVSIPAERVLAVYSDHVNGKEVFVHVRIAEPAIERDGWGERIVERVRVLNRVRLPAGDYAPATYEVFEKRVDPTTGRLTWPSVEGPAPITIGVIALVPFITGKRVGASWRVRPPLRDIAYLQVEEFQQESNLKNVHELTCYPMLAANGIAKPTDAGDDVRIPVGPRAVLFAPPGQGGEHGEWAFIEPSSESILALQAHLEKTQSNMRDLGMLPLTQANLTVITTANVAMKAHSAVQAWALALKDALEQAFVFTAMWLGDRTAAPEVDVYTDFGVALEGGAELDSVLKAEGQGVLSRRTVQDEFRRRGVLSENFDADQEQRRLAGQKPKVRGAAQQTTEPAGAA